MKYSEAITKAIEEAVAQKRLYIFGQDIRIWGGQGGFLRGMYSKYPEHIYDTPISEATVASIATGMAMAGKHSLVEYAFLDFILHSSDSIINNTTKIEYFSNGSLKAPVTFYATINSNRGYGATHSQPLEYIFTNVPGLNVVYPSNSHDAYTLLKDSISGTTPTLFLTHKQLLDTQHKYENRVMGRANIIKQGQKATIVGYGRTIPILMECASSYDAEIIDLRYLSPLDMETIVESVRRTKRLLVIDDGYGAISAEIIANVVELLPNTRCSRLTTKFIHLGVNSDIESDALIDSEKIKNRVEIIISTEQ